MMTFISWIFTFIQDGHTRLGFIFLILVFRSWEMIYMVE